ncbi:MAG: glycosyltransferase family 1 protein [Lachnospiraceae bacterium]|nr:glycosyltransferase family 1 protein [Lachnospiraceae bacterium]
MKKTSNHKEALMREMKRRTLSTMHFAEYAVQKRHIEDRLKYYDPTPIANHKPEGCRIIAFMITRMVRFHGGQTSILRIGTELEKLGIRVYYLVYKSQSREDMCICAESNLPGYKGRCLPMAQYLRLIEAGKCKTPDFVCASSWDTVSLVKQFENSYKLYFVQDYEPYFYPFGEEFLMCRNTYFEGLHMVSLGAWNREMILREGKTDRLGKPLVLDCIDFPYEPGEYDAPDRDYDSYATRKRFTIAAYVKYYGKRLPSLIPYMLQNTAARLAEKGIELEVLYYGEAKTFKPAGGRNLGQLNREEMSELYAKADFGMVASMSNISLVPFEMHAAGLPLIEFADGTYSRFLPPDSAILTSVGRKDIAAELLEAAAAPEKLRKMHDSAMAAMKPLSWSASAEQFKRIMEKAADNSIKILYFSN